MRRTNCFIKSADVVKSANALGVIDTYLKDADLDRTRIVNAEIVVTDHDNKSAFDEAWASWMPAGDGPVRSFVESVMPDGDLIEIIITAALPADARYVSGVLVEDPRT
jgi:enamine deaminase RidA (YjgF/YER057c/UK114 family)